MELWHNLCSNPIMAINLQEINRKHLLNADVVYRVNHGLCSKLVNYKNGILYIEVMFTGKWTKNYDQTTEEIARCWRDSNKELAHAIGCKVYIIDARKHNYKKDLYLHSKVASYDAKKGILFYDSILN